MKRVLLVLVMVGVPAVCAPRWVRRATAIAACAASAADGYATWQGAQVGMKEGNPLLRNAAGRPAMMRVIGFKAGLCGANLWLQERRGAREGATRDTWYTIANSAQAGVWSWVAWRNMGIADRMKAQSGSGGVAAFATPLR